MIESRCVCDACKRPVDELAGHFSIAAEGGTSVSLQQMGMMSSNHVTAKVRIRRNLSSFSSSFERVDFCSFECFSNFIGNKGGK